MASIERVGSDSMLTIEPMTDRHVSAVLAIYQEGIDSGHATFADQAPQWADWSAGHLRDCRLVAYRKAALGKGGIDGWAALSPVSARSVYRGVCELSIYVAAKARGRGVGLALLEALVVRSEHAGIWTLQAGIFPENQVSLDIHRRCGFKVVGVRERLGLMSHGPMAGQWRDVVLMERRSQVVGLGTTNA